MSPRIPPDWSEQSKMAASDMGFFAGHTVAQLEAISTHLATINQNHINCRAERLKEEEAIKAEHKKHVEEIFGRLNKAEVAIGEIKATSDTGIEKPICTFGGVKLPGLVQVVKIGLFAGALIAGSTIGGCEAAKWALKNQTRSATP